MKLIALLGVATSFLLASTELSIYNSNISFVQETKDIFVENDVLIYPDIPSNIITESILIDLSPNDKIFTQNFKYDTLNFQRLSELSIGKDIIYKKKDSNTKNDAKLLSVNPILIKYKDNNSIFIADKEEISFKEIPTNLILKPNLTWTGDFKNKKYSANLKYLTSGLNWYSNYVFDLSKSDLKGWISIHNNSGADYINAKVNCFSGELNTVQPQENIRLMSKSISTLESSDNISPTNISSYYSYKIPFRLNLKNKETTQVKFFEKNTEYEKYTKISFRYIGKEDIVSHNMVKFKPGLIPGGKIRMYDRDDSGNMFFVGENKIGNISEDEDIEIITGKSFDIKGNVEFVNKSKSYTNVSKHDKQIMYDIVFKVDNFSNKSEKIILDAKSNLSTYHLSNINCDKCDIINNQIIFHLNKGEKKEVSYSLSDKK